MAFEDKDLTIREKQIAMIRYLYIEPLKERDIEQGFERANWFLNGGDVSRETNEKSKDEPRLYSFSKDANYIFAAFRQTHSIDLQEAENLHWWKFIALFMDIGKDTTFSNLTSLRKRHLDGKLSTEEQAAAKEMGDTFYIAEWSEKSPEEEAALSEFMRLHNQGKEDAKT